MQYKLRWQIIQKMLIMCLEPSSSKVLDAAAVPARQTAQQESIPLLLLLRLKLLPFSPRVLLQDLLHRGHLLQLSSISPRLFLSRLAMTDLRQSIPFSLPVSFAAFVGQPKVLLDRSRLPLFGVSALPPRRGVGLQLIRMVCL